MQRSSAFLTLIPMFAAACGSVKNPQIGVDGGTRIDAPVDDSRALPSSCTSLGATAMNQNIQLYVDSDVSKPYTAHCSADLKTYLLLEGSNTSSYPLGGCGTLAGAATAAVTTTWQMVRFDTALHAIDTSDYQFATSAGGTHESSGDGAFVHDFLSIPFGTGRTCVPDSNATVATIDLTGTHFALGAAMAWAADGFTATSNAQVNAQRTKATITASGFPGSASPCAANSDYYTTNGGTCIPLEYLP